MGGAFFLIPGVGPIMMAGPFVSSIVGILEGAALVGGLSALGAAMVSIGVPVDSAIAYETDVRAGKFVLLFHGTPSEVERTRVILEKTQHVGMLENISCANTGASGEMKSLAHLAPK